MRGKTDFVVVAVVVVSNLRVKGRLLPPLDLSLPTPPHLPAPAASAPLLRVVTCTGTATHEVVPGLAALSQGDTLFNRRHDQHVQSKYRRKK